MSILGLSTPSLTSTTSTTASDQSTLSSNENMFLSLLVTQMQNQDPLNPTDASSFTQQLVQYSQVEQQIKTNAYLESLKALSTTQNAANLVSYIGKTVEADASTSHYDGTNSATWNFTSSAASTKATITVTNSSGETVYTGTKSLTKGDNSFTCDGTTSAGGTASAGDYTIAVSGSDTSGKAVTITTSASGVCTAVDFSGETPLITVGGQQISVWSVTSVSGGS
ncbi:MAG: flagellar hook assembly protein FlgD [Phyllobacteriaceae bacterium]|nr:flagellar hook assembly protein FlgD [Phyllobacteriaceae bacterium]